MGGWGIISLGTYSQSERYSVCYELSNMNVEARWIWFDILLNSVLFSMNRM
jgi:hypothetical protein